MITLLPKIIKWTEILGIVLSVLGLFFKALHLAGANEFIMIGLMTLAVTYFLSAYVFVPGQDDKPKKGFVDLLHTILRKLMYIGLSVYWVAFLFTILHLSGANEMMTIGFGTLAISAGASIILVIGNRESMKFLQAPLIRVVFTFLIYFTLPFFR